MFLESPRFPDTIAFGATGGPRFFTAIADSPSGTELRSGQWTQDLNAYEVGLVNRGAEETQAMLAFFRAVAVGRANGFRFKDFGAGESSAVNQLLGVGDGIVTQFQLRKLYLQEDESYAKLITKPVAGTVRCTLNGTATTAFTVNAATGVVTFTSPPGDTVQVHASFQYDIPVRLNTDWLRVRCVSLGVYAWDSCELVEIRDIS